MLRRGVDLASVTGRLRIVIAITIVFGACDTRPPTFPVAPSTTPLPIVQPTAQHTLSGTVSELIGGMRRPIAFRRLFLWIERQTGPGTFTGSSHPIMSDHNGRYSLSVPESNVSVSAWEPGELQPCLARTDVRTDTNLDVEVVSGTDALAGWTPEQLAAARPIVTGFVYEATADGRRPLPDAAIWVDISIDVYHGFTRTDDSGRFFLCRINSPIRIDVDLAGYEGTWRSLRGGGDEYLAIELRRR
jgi:hypothetical protein